MCYICVKLRGVVSAARAENDKRVVATRAYMDQIETFTAERHFIMTVLIQQEKVLQRGLHNVERQRLVYTFYWESSV